MHYFADSGNHLVYFELRRFVTQNPGAPVIYAMDGERYEHDQDNKDHIRPVPWWQHKLLLFKPVDNDRPKVCIH